MSIGTIQRDGNIWFATTYDFRNLQLDSAGFGETPEQAHRSLMHELRMNPFHSNQRDYPYEFERFEVLHTRPASEGEKTNG